MWRVVISTIRPLIACGPMEILCPLPRSQFSHDSKACELEEFLNRQAQIACVNERDTVIARRKHPPAVWSESHGPHLDLMLQELGQESAIVGIPDASRAILTRRRGYKGARRLLRPLYRNSRTSRWTGA